MVWIPVYLQTIIVLLREGTATGFSDCDRAPGVAAIAAEVTAAVSMNSRRENFMRAPGRRTEKSYQKTKGAIRALTSAARAATLFSVWMVVGPRTCPDLSILPSSFPRCSGRRG